MATLRHSFLIGSTGNGKRYIYIPLPLSVLVYPTTTIATSRLLFPFLHFFSFTAIPIVRPPSPPFTMLNIVSPLSKVPPEILGEIFYQCSLYASDAPLALSAVCSRFRSVALTTPQIWRRLRLVVNSEDELAQATAKAKRWFSLAGTCSLDLYIDLSALTTTTPIQSLSDLGTMPSHLGSSPLVELQKDGFEASGRVGCDCKGVRNLQVLLHSHSGRIQSLALRFVTQLDAQAFLQAIYAKEGSTNAAPAWQAQFNASGMFQPEFRPLGIHTIL